MPNFPIHPQHEFADIDKLEIFHVLTVSEEKFKWQNKFTTPPTVATFIGTDTVKPCIFTQPMTHPSVSIWYGITIHVSMIDPVLTT